MLVPAPHVNGIMNTVPGSLLQKYNFDPEIQFQFR
jgi:hypothetical protein